MWFVLNPNMERGGVKCFELGQSISFTTALNPYAAGGLFDQYRIMHKTWEMTETLANGYSYESTHQELSNEYQHDRV